jgi:hypothetical protein
MLDTLVTLIVFILSELLSKKFNLTSEVLSETLYAWLCVIFLVLNIILLFIVTYVNNPLLVELKGVFFGLYLYCLFEIFRAGYLRYKKFSSKRYKTKKPN